MHLTPHERDRLLVAAAADLARRRLARGARLGATEATALIVDEIYERAWDGHSIDDVQREARAVLSRDDVLQGVAEMIQTVQVDALFPAGTFLVEVRDPLDARGSQPSAGTDGKVRHLNAGLPRRSIESRNRSDRIVRVTSHVDFSLVNQALDHDREQSRGWRLDIPAGSSLAWLPDESLTVQLVPVNPDGARRGER